MDEIIVNPSQFVRENQGSFREIYKLGAVLGNGSCLYFQSLGAFGEVRKCVQRKSGMMRAVKILRKNALQNENEKERFLAEIKILKQLVYFKNNSLGSS